MSGEGGGGVDSSHPERGDRRDRRVSDGQALFPNTACYAIHTVEFLEPGQFYSYVAMSLFGVY